MDQRTRRLSEQSALPGRTTASVKDQIPDNVLFGGDFPFLTPAEGIELTRGVRDIGGTNGMPPVSEETVERIITSDPFAHR